MYDIRDVLVSGTPSSKIDFSVGYFLAVLASCHASCINIGCFVIVAFQKYGNNLKKITRKLLPNMECGPNMECEELVDASTTDFVEEYFDEQSNSSFQQNIITDLIKL